MVTQTIGDNEGGLPAGEIAGGRADTLEDSLAAAERAVDSALKSAAAVTRELRRALGGVRNGQIRDARKALAGARAAAAALGAETRALSDGFDPREQEYLASGGYVKELLAAAEARGVKIFEEEDRLLCYPSVVRVIPAEAAVEIDRVRERRLRPSVLVEMLARTQDRAPRFKAETFLDSLRAGYELVVASEHKKPDGVVRLVDIWTVLTMLPGQRGQYSKQEFARDLYLLDQGGVTRTARNSRTLRWSASTGTKGSGVLITVARDGQRQQYWGISFTADDDGAQ